MKALKLLVLLLFMLSFSPLTRAQSGWFSLQSGTQTKLSTVYFLNSMTGWTAGNNEIRVTLDGGISWIPQADFSGCEDQNWLFNSIYFVNSMTGWAAGEYVVSSPWIIRYDIIYRTTNGGANWIQQYNGIGAGLNSLYFINPAIGWSVGGSRILVTYNGGFNWVAHDFCLGENYSCSFNSVYFANLATGWVVAELYSEPSASYSKVIFKTTDGGMTLSQEYFENGIGLNSVQFINSTTGWTIGENKILKTNNGGQQWTEYYVCWGANYYCTLNSVYFTDPLTGWAAGKLLLGLNFAEYNVVYNTTDGGVSWSEQYRSAGKGLTSIHFMNAMTGWCVGNEGVILKTTDGGVIFMEGISTTVPKQYSLYQNYPNPFNPATTIRFDIPKSGNVTVRVFDILGKEVAALVNEKLLAGEYESTWNAVELPSGVYFCRINAGDFSETRKMILLK